MASSRLAAAVICSLVVASSADCSTALWTQAYSPEACSLEGPAAIVKCVGKTGEECGTRLEGQSKVGIGSHSMTIKAAPGPGVVTTFYMSTNGGLYDKSCKKPWVELDFEIMGNQAGSESKIWTNLLRGTCQENWQWITVPFDVSADYHTYAFDVSKDSISWLVDGVVYRKVPTGKLGDAHSASTSNTFRSFVSVWGKSSSDAGEGIPAFRNALGALDSNTNGFPLHAGFKLPAPTAEGETSAPASASGPSTDAALASGAASADGPVVWGSCHSRHCCSDGSTCYEKDETFAQCRPSCTPGIHDDDLAEYRTSWSCRTLAPALRR